MVKAKKWILAHYFDGTPKDSDLQLVEETLPALENGDVLLEAVYLSVDPYMRFFSAQLIEEGDTMIGEQIALVKDSRNPKFPIGSHVSARVGWRSHTVTSDESVLRLLPNVGNQPLSYHLGILGMPGITAYFGLLEVGALKKGEVILVTGGAGAVGSVVGQIGKMKGCKVISFAGSEEKCRWLREDLKLDFVFNYKTVSNIDEAIKKAAPDGVDVFVDMVGGELYGAGVRCMKDKGRVVVIGSISNYNDKGKMIGPAVNLPILTKELKILGYLVFNHPSRWNEGIKVLAGWIKEGKLVPRETVTTGFQNMRTAFYGLFTGTNMGKSVVKV